MTDWSVLLTPLVLLPILLLLGFSGCQVLFPVEDYGDDENTGTTTGGQPSFITIDMKLSAPCGATADAITIVLSSDISTEQFTVTLTTIPSEDQTISTEDLKITLEDEGLVFCTIEITPAEGEPPPLLKATHDKVKDELVAAFELNCQDGFELS